ncbi:MAG: 4Fe-4S single cluster domain-containing protein, partial [Acidobacteriota bacterium]
MLNREELKVHSIIECTEANGPGKRLSIWTSGCTLKCKGCFNPETHPASGTIITRADLLKQVIAAKEMHDIEGITISGGEPLQQMWPVIHFLQSIREHTDLSVVLFTGFNGDELWRMRGSGFLPSLCDVIICGRYEQDKRVGNGLI